MRRENVIFEYFLLGMFGGVLANLAAIVDMELKKREADTSAAKWLSRAIITCNIHFFFGFAISIDHVKINLNYIS